VFGINNGSVTAKAEHFTLNDRNEVDAGNRF
jgi:hypothetical protein